jgi:hypothetical protein
MSTTQNTSSTASNSADRSFLIFLPGAVNPTNLCLVWTMPPHQRSIALVLLLCLPVVEPFSPVTWRKKHERCKLSAARSDLHAAMEQQQNAQLIQAVFEPESALQQVNLVGKAFLNSTNGVTACAVLSRNDLFNKKHKHFKPQQQPCLLLPMTANQLKLVSFAVHNKPISNVQLLALNSLIVNRDDGLFDNLPWSSWTIDSKVSARNVDAAKNAVEPKYHLGKRDAYNRLMGKDWRGSSLTNGNLALRLQILVQNISSADNVQPQELVLARRILELQLRELATEQADWEYQIARSKQQSGEDIEFLEAQKLACFEARLAMQRRLNQLNKAPSSSDAIQQLLDTIAKMSNKNGNVAAPYRGAIGFAPMMDSLSELENSIASPFGMMKEIIEDQLKAQVIGVVLENTSLLQTALGGVLLLKRKMGTKSMVVAGETLTINDEKEEFGCVGIRGGETIVVECDADEAIGMSLACNVPLQVEFNIWKQANLMAQSIIGSSDESMASVHLALPVWKLVDSELSILFEGQAVNQSTTARVAPLRIPRTTMSLYDRLFEKRSIPSDMFPTDNLIKSLAQYDELSTQDKALTLLSMSNFEGRLPRPRVVRQSEKALDDLLLPLIDESVRRQYLIRDADRRGDTKEVALLKAEKSKRQIAKEMAEQARNDGMDHVADKWETEMDFYSSLRADVTQDEGEYSRFL